MCEDKAAALKEALSMIQQAFKSLTLEEVKVVKELQQEVDAAVKAGTASDPKLEFCYSVKFCGEKLTHPELRAACEAYIAAAE